ncbi:hypothetical protein [Sinorhizobium meliloti]|uniref:hypothetical protein n=1 Tax=Rhizobium meliloti TaxID=382 RepID=UPI001295A162|nr:hypothetical protein [Sinorhizobium meliloti]MQV80677.1 hypothetical protein [Sinorhizobium meliloti]
MANKLEINVVADTSDAQKGIKDLEKDIEAVGKAAEDTTSVAAKQASLWGDSLAGVKAALPTPADAKGIEAIGDAALVASRSTAIVETRMQRLGRVMSTMGRTLASGFSQAFTGLARAGLAAGRLLGTAIMTGLKLTAIGAIIALGYTIYQQFRTLFDKISGAAAASAKAIRDAFSAGLEVSQLRAFEGLGKALGLSEEAATDMAQAMGELNVTLREGGEPARQLDAIVKTLGGDLAALDPANAQSVANFLSSIQGSYKQLDALQQKAVLEKLFPSASVETLAQIHTALNGATIDVGKLTEEISKYQKQAAATDKWNSTMAASWGKLTAAAGNLWNAWLELTGIGQAFQEATNALPAMVSAMANHVNAAAEVVRNLPQLISKAATEVLAAFKAMFDQLVQAAITGWNAVWDAAVGAVNAGIAKVKSALSAFADWFEERMRAIRAAGSATAIGGMAGQQQQRQSVPMPFAGGGVGLRAAGALYQNPYSGLSGRAAPRAANSNIGTGLTAQMDQILFRWKEYEKQVESAAVATQAASKTITTSMKTASAGTDELVSSATAANDNLSAMSETAVDMNSEFSAWAEDAVMGFVDAAIAGEDFRDVLAGILADLAKMALQKFVMGPLFSGLFPGASATAPAGLNAAAGGGGTIPYGLDTAATGLGGLANIAGRGISPTAGGETINNNIGDINIDMPRGQVTATTEDGKRLGLQIEKAVQAILVKESKPGGILRQVA